MNGDRIQEPNGKVRYVTVRETCFRFYTRFMRSEMTKPVRALGTESEFCEVELRTTPTLFHSNRCSK